MTVFGFLHTSPIHVATFDALVAELAPEAYVGHVVDEDLLARARAEGPGAVRDAVRRRLDELAAAGADVVCCTCSTIGQVAEDAGAAIPVVRVDRPMARRAVAIGPRIAVLAALDSALLATSALLDDEADRAATLIAPTLRLVPGAWDLFEAGDQDGYLRAVADDARAVADGHDVVLLAQASMAGAEPLLADLGVPVLSAPRPAVTHLARTAGTAAPAAAPALGSR